MKALLLCLACLFSAAPAVAQEPDRPVIQLRQGIRLVSIFSHMSRLFAVFVLDVDAAKGIRQIDLVDIETGQVVFSVIEGVHEGKGNKL